jgi:hypothetical protein
MPFSLGELINYVNRSDNLTNLVVVVVAISNQKHRNFRAVRCPCIILKSRAYNVHNNTRHLKFTCIITLKLDIFELIPSIEKEEGTRRQN